MAKGRKAKPTIITVFYGAKLWTEGSTIIAPSVEYQLGRGKSAREARIYSQGLLAQLNDFSNRSLLEKVMLSAQRSGLLSPFVSTSLKRDVARSFALAGGSPGFILTIQGPEEEFYKFNQIREDYGIPHPSEFYWLDELGIPLKVKRPFEIVEVDKVLGVTENKVGIYKKGRK